MAASLLRFSSLVFAVLIPVFLLIAYLTRPGFRFSTRRSLRVGFRRILSHRSFLFLLPLPLFHSALSSAPFSRIVAPFFSFPSIFFIARFSLMSSSWQGTEIASEGEGKVLGWPQSEGRILGSS